MIEQLHRIGIISKIKHERSTTTRHHRITNIAKFINEETLKISHIKQLKDKAKGIDGVTKEEYGKDLEDNLLVLVKNMKSGKYKPKPVKRVYIPKGNGKVRPLGILSYEDKVVAYTISQILSEIYECRFHENSYGFRPKRNCHMAIKQLIEFIQYRSTNYVFETDIRGCFDNINHEILIEILRLDIADKKFIGLIGKFLEAGIWEKSELTYSTFGTPQGNPMSPVLTNIFLHYILDMWIEIKVKPILKGEMYFVRYADDFACTFQYRNDAETFENMLNERFHKYGLQLAEEKTRLIEFGRYANGNAKKRGERKAKTFNFLGFTFYCSMDSHKRFYRVKVKTNNEKLTKKLKEIKKWLKDNLTTKLTVVLTHLRRVMIGHYNYFGVTDNSISLYRYLWRIRGLLFKWFNRRSQRKSISYFDFGSLFGVFLKNNIIPIPRIRVSLLTY